ncbi:MAG: hypothetical protein ABII82_13075 [Verrucomicrobiota bacterium]
MRRVIHLLVILSGLVPATPTAVAEPLPRAPLGSRVIPARPDLVVEGRGWITDALHPDRRGLHLDGAATVRLELAPLGLAPGLYNLGIVARTGTRWADAQDQIARYRWRVAGAGGTFRQLAAAPFQPVRASGDPESWGNWYGTLQASAPVRLTGNEHVEITNRENHGGIVSVWIQPATTASATGLELGVLAPNHAFGHGQAPAINLSFQRLSSDAHPLPVEVEWLDLVTGKSSASRLRVAAELGTVPLHPELRPGVYRLRVTHATDAAPVENPASAETFFAVSAARPAAGLPDDWPLGAHVDTDLPPLPGFRWYRYFAQWAKTNPARGTYDWSAFDQVFESVQAVGGRLLVASDGSPVWTSARGKAGMTWEPAATAHPPDDWDDLRAYLDGLLARYTDERGTLGALELCNEANTPDRWLGDTDDQLAMARTFRAAVDAAGARVQIIGIVASAGDQRGYVARLAEAGLLDHVDAVSAHFYEELMSPGVDTPINNLPRHVAMLSGPMADAGKALPMINTESGIEFAARIDGVPPTQDEINARDEADPGFDPARPWLLGPVWRPVSERRAAATYATGTVQLMALGVRRTYVFSQLGLMRDGAPSLPWVALGQLGGWLDGVDTGHIRPLQARYREGNNDDADGSPQALAYLIGRPDGKRVIIAFGYRRDTRVGRGKHWQPWLDPRPLEITTDVAGGRLHDLYDRDIRAVRTADGRLTIPCGEEPVCVIVR